MILIIVYLKKKKRTRRAMRQMRLRLISVCVLCGVLEWMCMSLANIYILRLGYDYLISSPAIIL